MPKIHAVFKHRGQLDLMLSLRVQGYSMRFLAALFGCDRKAIRYQCVRFGVYPLTNDVFYKVIVADSFDLNPTLQEESKWNYVDGEKVNRGKSYADYLKDLELRKSFSPPRKDVWV